ncbi:unnamed protein product [Acanthoscelides obtectus]|uniref:Uncharacterized protein n=1 Tax=Acanthoscelides obtectus TaxID=200917 RepID=A0A9P0P599_ACAOB|nr:unnamed protein product [Acanthoscelides obtectus]CAK1672654.1 hypothetical protein AOBTE_LOCUS29023 [Acanthoscelides obtectus]
MVRCESQSFTSCSASGLSRRTRETVSNCVLHFVRNSWSSGTFTFSNGTCLLELSIPS